MAIELLYVLVTCIIFIANNSIWETKLHVATMEHITNTFFVFFVFQGFYVIVG